jgi:hypothetical protein
VVIAGGLFAEGFVYRRLTVAGDDAATLRQIAEHASLWRTGIVAHLTFLVAALAINVILYRLLRPSQPVLAPLAFALNLIDIAIEGAAQLLLAIPLMSGPPEIASAALRLYEPAYRIALFFFGGFCVLLGVGLIRARVAPTTIGVLMVGAGAGYLVNTLTAILAPAVSDAINPAVLLPSLVGEVSLAAWLVFRGIPIQEEAR